MTGGKGGDGATYFMVSASGTVYGGGGGGGAASSATAAGAGGAGGGGAGGLGTVTASSGTNGLGGGGGGGGFAGGSNGASGAGGSGIVIVRYCMSTSPVCPPLSVAGIGNITYSNARSQGSTATFVCTTGSVLLSGSASTTCTTPLTTLPNMTMQYYFTGSTANTGSTSSTLSTVGAPTFSTIGGLTAAFFNNPNNAGSMSANSAVATQHSAT